MKGNLGMNMSLSFGIVTYNNADLIASTIQSIQEAAKQFEYTIYVIDNGSSDGTQSIVQGIDGNVELTQSTNLGFGHGHNEVIEKLHSKYHFLVNPDISFEENDLQIMVEYMEANANVGLLMPLIKNEDGTIQYLFRKEPTVFDAAIRFLGKNMFKKRQDSFVNMDSGYNKILPVQNASGSFMMLRTDVFQQVGGFDDRYFMYYEDADLTRKVNEVSTAMFVPTAQVTHAWERASSRKIKFIIIMLQSLVKYMNKWGWKWI